jgi:hypothetical protein
MKHDLARCLQAPVAIATGFAGGNLIGSEKAQERGVVRETPGRLGQL